MVEIAPRVDMEEHSGTEEQIAAAIEKYYSTAMQVSAVVSVEMVGLLIGMTAGSTPNINTLPECSVISVKTGLRTLEGSIFAMITIVRRYMMIEIYFSHRFETLIGTVVLKRNEDDEHELLRTML